MSSDRTCFRNRIFRWQTWKVRMGGGGSGIGPWRLPSLPFAGVSRSFLILEAGLLAGCVSPALPLQLAVLPESCYFPLRRRQGETLLAQEATGISRPGEGHRSLRGKGWPSQPLLWGLPSRTPGLSTVLSPPSHMRFPGEKGRETVQFTEPITSFIYSQSFT